MQDSLTQIPTQPFLKLAQGNMDLLTRFMASPAVASHPIANGSEMFRRAVESTTTLMQSRTFLQLVQGMLGNYTAFLAEVSQSSVTMMGQAHAALVRQTGEATANVIDAAEVRGSMKRQAS
jgi:hypothetical protein